MASFTCIHVNSTLLCLAASLDWCVRLSGRTTTTRHTPHRHGRPLPRRRRLRGPGRRLYECLGFHSHLAFSIGGTTHLVIKTQIGFMTDPPLRALYLIAQNSPKLSTRPNTMSTSTMLRPSTSSVRALLVPPDLSSPSENNVHGGIGT